MALSNTRLNETNGFRSGQRLTARHVDAMHRAAKAALNVSVNEPGTHVIVDSDGVHRRRQYIPTPEASIDIFWAIVVAAYPSSGYVLCRTATGTLGALRPKDSNEVPFRVWVGFETFFRGPAGSWYDEILCIPNNSDVNSLEYPYTGLAMMPGFAHEEPTIGYSPEQDHPALISDDASQG